jgi:hypothetical protein
MKNNHHNFICNNSYSQIVKNWYLLNRSIFTVLQAFTFHYRSLLSRSEPLFSPRFLALFEDNDFGVVANGLTSLSLATKIQKLH